MGGVKHETPRLVISAVAETALASTPPLLLLQFRDVACQSIGGRRAIEAIEKQSMHIQSCNLGT